MMDNQYNYYRPDSDENRGADNQQGFGAGPQQNPKAPKPKKGYAKKVALVVRGSWWCDDAGNQLSDW
mgnify:CR=1 FL=1